MLRKDELDKFQTAFEIQPIDQAVKMKLYYKKNHKEFDESFIDAFKELLNKGVAMQKENKAEEIHYINFSILRSSIINKAYEVRIDLYDKTYCVNSREISVNWNVECIFNFIEDDIEDFLKKNPITLKHAKEYEKNYLRFKALEDYKDILYAYLKNNMYKVTSLQEYKDLIKSDDINIFLGEYFERPEYVIDIQEEE